MGTAAELTFWSMKATPSLKDIAKAAGVAAMTVSRALRDNPKISLRRRREIQALAQRMGYRPDPQISRLMSRLRTARPKRTETVMAALSTLNERTAIGSNVHQRAFFVGARERAFALGYRLEEFWANEPGLSPRRLEHILFSRGIEALLLMPYGPGFAGLEIDYSRFSVAAIGRSQADQLFHRVCQNHYRAVELALRHVQQAGYGRIGMVLSEVLDRRAGRRYSSAFLQHLHTTRPAARVPLFESMEWDEKRFLRWYRRHHPDVILATSKVVRQRLEAVGIHAPRDVGFVNLDLIAPGDRSSGVDQNYGRIGAAAVDLLAEQVNHHEKGLSPFPKTVLIDGYWQNGDSLSGPGPDAEPGRFRSVPSGARDAAP